MAKNTALLDYLEKAGIGQNEFAASQGITASTMSRYVSGIVKISLETALEIQKATKGAVPVESWVRR